MPSGLLLSADITSEAANNEHAAPTRNMQVSEPTSEKQAGSEIELARARRMAEFLDSEIALPGGLRIGADGLIGLIPGVGDLASGGISLWIVHKARQLGVPKRKLALMLARVAVDSTLGVIPVAGDVFDFFYKANLKNIRLLIEHLENN